MVPRPLDLPLPPLLLPLDLLAVSLPLTAVLSSVLCSVLCCSSSCLPLPLPLPIPHRSTPLPPPLLPLPRLLYTTLLNCSLLMGVHLVWLSSKGFSPQGSPARHRGATGIVPAAHVSPYAAATPGSIKALDTPYRMMALLLVAEDASTVYGGAGDPLPPGRGHAHFVVLPVAWWRRCGAIWALPLVRVPVLVLAKFVRTISGVNPRVFTMRLRTLGAKNKKVTIRNKNILCITKSKYLQI